MQACGAGWAGFPTGKKWGYARNNDAEERYLICNADEGDPGAFMDRSLLEGTPHAVLEGMLIASYAIGAKNGIIYVRAEYPLAVQNTLEAIAQMERMGLLGEDMLGTGAGNDYQVEFDRVQVGRLERGARGLQGQGGGALIVGCDSSLADAGSGDNPVIARLHLLCKFAVG